MRILKTVNLKGLGKKHSGKVRDFYIYKNQRILITTDRISAFDVNLGYIPYKGQVLNELAAFWFKQTEEIIDNHILSVPDPNVTVAKNAKPLPIEMVVRGYITGVTNTSIWGSYEKGERTIYGLKFPEGLKKNQKLPSPVLTPTTKAEVGHDERLTREEIIKKKIVPKNIYLQMEKASLALFAKGTKIADRKGLILVDTKYEFGLDDKGKLMLIDEIHTPDSSRFWKKSSYKEKFKNGKEPESFDKEFLRIWYAKKGYKGDGKPPKMTAALQKKVSKLYLDVYENITGKKIVLLDSPIETRIKKNLLNLFTVK